MTRTTTLGLSAFIAVSAEAQFTINDSLDVNALANLLEGIGVTVSNVTVNCAPQAMAQFYGASELQIAQGLLLTSGSADVAAGPSSAFASGTNGTPGDADLEAGIGMGVTYDACGLEFDCVPVGDTLLFNFSFGSEEYPEFVGSNFNDAFAIYISGPGFLAPTNVAAIPGGTIVSINNVNAAMNAGFFHDNENPPGNYVAYDGFTTNLTAFAVVQPGETYHFKVVVADVSDPILDSGVFLEAFSFRSMMDVSSGIQPRDEADLFMTRQGDDLLLHLPRRAVHGQPVRIIDAAGAVVRQVAAKDTQVTVGVGGLTQGMYFVQVLDSELAPVRFVKE